MTNSLTQKFGEVKHQPKGMKKFVQAEKLRRTAPYVLAGIVSGGVEMKAGDYIPPGVLVSARFGQVLWT